MMTLHEDDRNRERLTVVSTFSGCGGLDLGFIWEGYRILWANDVDPEACETYKVNTKTDIVKLDMEYVDVDNVPRADVVIGGPPCQPFSMIGKRDPKDTRGIHIWEFAKLVEALQPSAFLMENVTGLLSASASDGSRVIDSVLAAFNDEKRMGYKTSASVLNAADYGVPQLRRRLFILGFKGDNALQFPEKTHLESPTGEYSKWVTVEEAIGDLPPPVDDGVGTIDYDKEPASKFQKWARQGVARGEPAYNHWLPHMSELDKQIIKYVPVGGNYMDVPDHVPSVRIKKYKETGGRTTTYGRMRPDRPSYTLNTYFSRPNVGCNIHYKEDRLITIREGLRLQSFKDDYRIPHTVTKRGQYKLVGNAVPPLLAQALAHSIKEQLARMK